MDIWQASLAEDGTKRLAQLLSNKQNRPLINKRNSEGFTALHLASYSGHYENIKLLCSYAADTNMKDKSKTQWTACHWAAITGNIRILLLLCENGGKLDITDNNDKTPLDYLLQAQKGERIKRDFDLMVFTWGSGVNYQLGHGDQDRKLTPKKVKALEGKQIIQIAASKYHTIVVLDNGQVYSFGFGSGGRLGHGGVESELLPRKIEQGITNKKIISASASSQYSALLTNNGELYTFGTGPLGYNINTQDNTNADPSLLSSSPSNCSMPNIEPLYIPRRVRGALETRTVVQVSCSTNHCAAVTVSGALFTWGKGEYGALGHGTFQDQLLPREVASLKDYGVKSVAVGSQHTLALTTQGYDIFTFGFGKYFPRKVILVAPKSPKPAISQISANGIRSAAVTIEGKVYTWTGSMKEDIIKPTLITNLEVSKVSKVALGGSGHIVLLSDNGDVLESYHSKTSLSNFNFSKMELARVLDIAASKAHSVAIVQSNAAKNIYKSYSLITNNELIKYVNNREFSDLVFKLKDDKIVYAHKIIIASRIYNLRDNISTINEILLPTIDYNIFMLFMKYIYTDSICTPSSDIEMSQLVELAQIYKMKSYINRLTTQYNILLSSLCDKAEEEEEDEEDIRRKTNVEEESTFREDISWCMTATSMSDVKLIVEDQIFECHKVILSARCSYFSTMFRAGLSETNTSSIQLFDLRTIIAKRVLDFIYTDEIPKLTIKDSIDLLLAADQFFLNDLKTICASAINSFMDLHNLVTFIELARMSDCNILLQYCFEYLLDHLPIVISGHLISEIEEETLCQFEIYLKSKLPTSVANPLQISEDSDDENEEEEETSNNEENTSVDNVATDTSIATSTISSAEAVKRSKLIKKKLQQISQLEDKVKNGASLDNDQVNKMTMKEKLQEELLSLESLLPLEEELLPSTTTTTTIATTITAPPITSQTKSTSATTKTPSVPVPVASTTSANLKKEKEVVSKSPSKKETKITFGSVQSVRSSKKDSEKSVVPPQSPVKAQAPVTAPTTPTKPAGWATASAVTPPKKSFADIQKEESEKFKPKAAQAASAKSQAIPIAQPKVENLAPVHKSPVNKSNPWGKSTATAQSSDNFSWGIKQQNKKGKYNVIIYIKQ